MGVVYVQAKALSNSSGGHASTSGPRSCVSCGDELKHEPVLREGRAYCCEGCADGGPCHC